ncbi:MAG: hypothetical protein QNJ92_00060 [Alphaproteobacteria bacterium]|nr:hypothetical protein [Alphaproteobacteria bacterium]
MTNQPEELRAALVQPVRLCAVGGLALTMTALPLTVDQESLALKPILAQANDGGDTANAAAGADTGTGSGSNGTGGTGTSVAAGPNATSAEAGTGSAAN